MSSESDDGDEFMLDVSSSIDVKCHNTNQNLYGIDGGGIKVSHLNYNNNENWVHCLRILNDNSKNDALFEYPILRIQFELSMLDLEHGFDNLFITFQQDERYDDYVYVWTGNNTQIHSFKHEATKQNDTNGTYLTEKVFWNTLAHHLSFTEIWLNFQSDDTIVYKGKLTTSASLNLACI